MTQDQFGRIYAGGAAGLFRYDGHEWLQYGTGRVLYPCFDGVDAIYGIANNKFGRWKVGPRSLSEFESLMPLVCQAASEFQHPIEGSQVRSVSLVKGEVFFTSTRQAVSFRSSDNSVNVRAWQMRKALPKHKVRRVAQWQNRVFFQTEHVDDMTATGLAELLEDGSLNPMPPITDAESGKIVKRHYVGMTELGDSSNQLVLCGQDAISVLDPKTFQSRVILRQGQPFASMTTTNNGVCIASYYHGFYFFDRTLRPLARISETSIPGIHSSNAPSSADEMGRLWCASKSTLYRIDYGSDVLMWEHTAFGSPKQSCVFMSHMVVATDLGLFIAPLSKNTGLPIGPFSVSGERSIRQCVLALGETLFVGGISGLWANTGKPHLEGAYKINGGFCNGVLLTQDPDSVIAIFGNQQAKLVSKQEDGTWAVAKELDTLPRQSFGVTTDSGVWLCTSRNGINLSTIQRVDLTSYKVKDYKFTQAGALTFCIEKRVFVVFPLGPNTTEEPLFYEYSQEHDKFLPTDEFEELEKIFQHSGSANRVQHVDTFANGDLMIIANERYMLRGRHKAGRWKFTQEFSSIPRGYGYHGSEDASGNIWLLAGAKLWCKPARSLSRDNLPASPSAEVLFTDLRRADEQIDIAEAQTEQTASTLQYSDETVTVKFAVPRAKRPENAGFSHRMLGQNKNWSSWSKVPQADFAALREGSYTFEVKALLDSEYETEVSRINFTILPPWYRTFWLRSSVILFSATIVGLVLRWRLQQHAKQNALLRNEIADRKKAEERLHRSQANLLKRERLRALGEMAAGVAHDVNNALVPVVAFSEQISADQKTSVHTRKLANAIVEGVFDAVAITRRIQPLYQMEPNIRTPHNLAEIVNHAAQAATSVATARHPGKVIEITHQTQSFFADVAASDVREMISNLMMNAMDAIAGQGKITLKCYTQKEAAVIEVCDNGTGMTPEIRDRCMHPFYSTKQEAGTGLGLATTHAILGSYAGSITVDSTIGVGTTFKIFLPLFAQPAEINNSVLERANNFPELRILVVDDIKPARSALRYQLETLDQEVCDVESGEEAIQRIREEHFDLVMTDFAMQGMNGAELRRNLRRINFTNPVVFVTSAETPGLHELCDALLLKPTTLGMLRECLSKLAAKDDKTSGTSEIPGGA